MSICFKEVSKAFGQKIILNEISFEVPEGEILFVLGKSGMGKSVTLKTIVGMLKPDSGEVWVDGLRVDQADSQELAQIRGTCGMVFQHPALLDSLNVYQNLSFGLRTPQYRKRFGRDLSEEEIRQRCLEKISLVNLSQDIFEKYPSEISFGMQKRVSLARTLIPEPRYLLFDEPTTGLDPITTHAVNDLILELSRKLQVTSIVVSHDMSCALKIADRILVLDQAAILEIDSVEKIKRSQKPLIRDFLMESLNP